MIHRAANSSQGLPNLNSAILEQIQRDDELFEAAEEEMAEFDDVFDIQVNEDQATNKEARKRVYWRDIIEKEEQNQREREKQMNEQEMEEEQQIVENKPLTEQEIARMKGVGDDDFNGGNDKSIK